MEKTSRELGEKLIDLLKDIKEANSSFKVANLSQQALEVVKEWKQAKELEQKTQEPKPEPKDVEIIIHPEMDILLGRIPRLRIGKHDIKMIGIPFVAQLLSAILSIEVNKSLSESWKKSLEGIFRDGNLLTAALRDYIIQIIEEKFGLTIKICGNCKNFAKNGPNVYDFTICGLQNLVTNFGSICKYKESSRWTPKEIPTEKKEEEKSCKNCGVTVADSACLHCYERNHWRLGK